MYKKKQSISFLVVALSIGTITTSPAFAAEVKGKENVVFAAIDAKTAERLLDSTILDDNLQSAKNTWIETICYKGEGDANIDKRCATKIGFSTVDLLGYVSAAEPDFNNDGKKDLVLAMGSMTGLSGQGACALGEYRLYENVGGGEYRPIGKMLQVNALGLKLGAKLKPGNYRDLVWETFTECPGLESVTEIHKFDKAKNRYYDLKDIES